MKNDLNLVFKYIKSYKARSIAIILSIVMGTALIVGVGTLARGAQQADLDRMKRELGVYHVRYKDINRDQLKLIRESGDIKNIGIESYYSSTDINEKLPINFVYADINYIDSDSKVIKGRFPKKNNEVVVEAWILNSMGLEPRLNQEITFKLYEKDKPETFKVVGILQDRYKDKSVGRCEVFLPLQVYKGNKLSVNVEFNESTDIRSKINDISNKIMVDKKNNVQINNMLVDSVDKNGTIDYQSRNTAIIVSFFAGLVVYSIYSISVYQRIREYGMLRAIGSTNLRVFRLMLLELITISAIAIPIGILFGMGGAQLFNSLSGNIKFEGDIRVTPFVIPTNIIILSFVCICIVILIISLITFMKIRKISPIEAIRRNFRADKKIKISKFAKIISKKLSVLNSVSMKNIFRDKKAFIIIIASLSIGGLLIIKNDYSYSGAEELSKDTYKKIFFNGDFILMTNGSIDKTKGLEDESIDEIKNIKGISEVKAAKSLYTRMKFDKKDVLNIDYFEEFGKHGGYSEKVMNGLIVKDNDRKHMTIKQKLKGFDKNMLKALEDYKVEGNIDINKMQGSNLAVVYIPYVYEPFENYYQIGDHEKGKPVVNVKVGDTVKVKLPKGKTDSDDYWKGKDNYEYQEFEFKVGAIVDYPYADDSMYSSSNGVDVIVSDTYLRSLTNINNYDIVYANMEEGADHKFIDKRLGKIGSQVPGTITTDMTKEKADTEKMYEKIRLYNYGILAVIFVISMINIINNVSYNLTSRTSEFGMLRAVGMTKESFEKMIVFEGLLYGLISGFVVVIGGYIIQGYVYKFYGFEQYGMEFAINYKIYLILIALNVIIGLLATYIPARKIKKVDIVESINIVE